MPHSKLKNNIAEILKQEGYIAGFTSPTRRRPGRRVLTLDLKYGPNRERSIAGVRRVSKPGLRVYAKSTGCRGCSAALARDHLDVVWAVDR